MATWELNITVKDVATKRVAITATRTTGEDVRSFTVSDAIVETAEQKAAILDQFWAMYQASVTKQTAVDAMVGTLESAGAANLNAREV